eukprot:TRINITY_DN14217_c0_g1_i4.p1 TRINITY_DN14217_c0_g1~~TRINITY_DN14217_c0_g1_i4.p1  ORF type:complete len:661 (-),score=81.51 TRINITY_DN14217_c0_g1_i4:82-2064(-)
MSNPQHSSDCECKCCMKLPEAPLHDGTENPFKSLGFAVRACIHDNPSPGACNGHLTPRQIAKQLAALQKRFVESHEQQVQELCRLLTSAGVEIPKKYSPSRSLQRNGLRFHTGNTSMSYGLAPSKPLHETAQSDILCHSRHIGLSQALGFSQPIGRSQPIGKSQPSEAQESLVPVSNHKARVSLTDVEAECPWLVTEREFSGPLAPVAADASTTMNYKPEPPWRGLSRTHWAEETITALKKVPNMVDTSLDRIINKLDSREKSQSARRELTLADRVYQITEHIYFDLFCGVVICLNAIWMAYETEHALTKPVDEADPAWMPVVTKAFTFFFGLEMIFRMCGGLIRFFCSCSGWNYFDLVIVAMSVADEFILASDSASFSNTRLLRLLRLTRTIKVFRMIRIVQFVGALRTLINSLMGTIRQVIWAFFLIICLMFIFAVIFGQVVSQARLADPEIMEEGKALNLYWGSLTRCMITLYMSISGGVSWIEPAQALESLGSSSLLGFMLYVALVEWVVLNVVTGVFCESAAEAARKDVALAVQLHRSDRDHFLQRCKAIFRSIDTDGSGRLSPHEMKPYLDSEPAHALFAALELDLGDVYELFELLDEDGSQFIDLEEFMFGCLRLRGVAKAIDIAKVQHETGRIQKTLEALIAALQHEASSEP